MAYEPQQIAIETLTVWANVDGWIVWHTAARWQGGMYSCTAELVKIHTRLDEQVERASAVDFKTLDRPATATAATSKIDSLLAWDSILSV